MEIQEGRRYLRKDGVMTGAMAKIRPVTTEGYEYIDPGSKNLYSNTGSSGPRGMVYHNLVAECIHQRVFKDVAEIGRWYMGLHPADGRKSITLFRFSGRFDEYGLPMGYGFGRDNSWFDGHENGWCSIYFVKAEDDDVKNALIREAKRRGLTDKGARIAPLGGRKPLKWGQDCDKFELRFNGTLNADGTPIFINGGWAELLPDELKIGEWYKGLGACLIRYLGPNTPGFGWGVHGKWTNEFAFGNDSKMGEVAKIASPEEIQNHFEAEVVLRFGKDWKNAKIDWCLEHGHGVNVNTGVYIPLLLPPAVIWSSNGKIYDGMGNWAKPFQEPYIVPRKIVTMKEVAEKFGVPVNKIAVRK